MSAAWSERLEYRGWRLCIATGNDGVPAGAREAVLDAAVEAAEGRYGAPLRRSRHASTWRVKVGDGRGGQLEVFVKRMDPARNVWAGIRRLWRAGSADYVVRIVEQLKGDGFGTPRIFLAGRERGSGCELVATRRLEGSMVTRLFNPRFAADLKTRRAVLTALGLEIARFHQKGYVHGDLTPYNVFVVSREPPRFAFIDHERTRRLGWRCLMAERQRMRNLVQLGHFDLPGVTLGDRMRVFASYVRARGLPPRKTLRKLAGMIERRLASDRAEKPGCKAGQPALSRAGEMRQG